MTATWTPVAQPDDDRDAAAFSGPLPPGRRRRPGRGLRIARHVVLAVLVGCTVGGAGVAVSAAGDAGTEPLGPGVVRVEVGIHHSRFDIGQLRVRAGTLLEVVVRNDDPIDHELVIGDAAVHARHRDGTERRHPPVPGEVSVAPGDTAMTFYELDEPGTVIYACHLPGHVAYGMLGEIEVIPTPTRS
ncbi:MAG: plastocyanin/azurin family copper-binding protein [Acidimicrobiales bacterium]